MAKFSIEEAIGFGWKTVKEHWTTLLPVVIVLFVINGLINQIIMRGHDRGAFMLDGGFRSLLSVASGNLLTTIVSVIFTAIAVKVCLQYVDGKAKDVPSLFQGTTPELLVKVIVASVLYNIMIGIGFVLLIIPGIYLALRYSMVTYILMDKPSMGIMEAFSESARMTDGVKWQLILFLIACGLIAFIGLIALVVGLVIALPLISVAMAHVYRQLSKSAGKKVEEVPAAA